MVVAVQDYTTRIGHDRFTDLAEEIILPLVVFPYVGICGCVYACFMCCVPTGPSATCDVVATYTCTNTCKPVRAWICTCMSCTFSVLIVFVKWVSVVRVCVCVSVHACLSEWPCACVTPATTFNYIKNGVYDKQ